MDLFCGLYFGGEVFYHDIPKVNNVVPISQAGAVKNIPCYVTLGVQKRIHRFYAKAEGGGALSSLFSKMKNRRIQCKDYFYVRLCLGMMMTQNFGVSLFSGYQHYVINSLIYKNKEKDEEKEYLAVYNTTKKSFEPFSSGHVFLDTELFYQISNKISLTGSFQYMLPRNYKNNCTLELENVAAPLSLDTKFSAWRVLAGAQFYLRRSL